MFIFSHGHYAQVLSEKIDVLRLAFYTAPVVLCILLPIFYIQEVIFYIGPSTFARKGLLCLMLHNCLTAEAACCSFTKENVDALMMSGA